MIRIPAPRPARRRLAAVGAAGLLLATVAGVQTGAQAAPDEAEVQQPASADGVTAQLAVDEISSSRSENLRDSLPAS